MQVAKDVLRYLKSTEECFHLWQDAVTITNLVMKRDQIIAFFYIILLSKYKSTNKYEL